MGHVGVPAHVCAAESANGRLDKCFASRGHREEESTQTGCNTSSLLWQRMFVTSFHLVSNPTKVTTIETKGTEVET